MRLTYSVVRVVSADRKGISVLCKPCNGSNQALACASNRPLFRIDPQRQHMPTKITTVRHWIAGMSLALFATTPRAGGIDHRLAYDNSGIWSHNVELAVMYTLIGGEVGCGFWEGGETLPGKTCWQAIDSSAVSAVFAQA